MLTFTDVNVLMHLDDVCLISLRLQSRYRRDAESHERSYSHLESAIRIFEESQCKPYLVVSSRSSFSESMCT
jgi:hypothetical protein